MCLKFRNKLYSGFGSVLLIGGVLFSSVTHVMAEMDSSLNQIVLDRYQKIALSNRFESDMSNINLELSALMLAKSPGGGLQEVRKIRATQATAYTKLSEMERTITFAAAQYNLNQLSKQYNDYTASVNRVVSLVRSHNTQLTTREFLQSESILNQVTELVQAENLIQDNAMEKLEKRTTVTYHRTLRWMGLIILLGLIAVLLLGGWTIRSLTRSLRRVSRTVSAIDYTSSERFPRLVVKAQDEIGEIAFAYNAMVTELERHIRQQLQYQNAIEEQSWLNSHVAEFLTELQSHQDIQSFSDAFLQRIAQTIGIVRGMLYLQHHVNADGTLFSIGRFAVGDDDRLSVVKIGQGLVGQCAKEKRVIAVDEVPPHYFKVQTGLGDCLPTNLYFFPIEYNHSLIGVAELALLHPLGERELSYLEKVLLSAGVIINNILSRAEIEKLLTESQAMMEELQTQQEELHAVNEELVVQMESTELKAKELEAAKQELEAVAEEVVRTSNYKSEFLANMSHELRTPLNSLLILAQILGENDDNNLTDKQVEYAKTIHSSGRNLLRLINEILDLSRIESGMMEVVSAPISLANIQETLMNEFIAEATQKSIHLQVSIHPHTPAVFYSDEHRILQILRNLASNAIKFTDQGSVAVHIAPHHEEPSLDGRASPPTLAISVTDTGIGIQSDKQSIIFDAFRQADGTTNRKYGGTGLGLSISKELASLLGGSIQLDSTPGLGSTFTLILPQLEPTGSAMVQRQVAAAAEPCVSAAEAIPTTHSKSLHRYALPDSSTHDESLKSVVWEHDKLSLKDKTILLVDDDMRNVFAITSALERYGIHVLFADNGFDGVKCVESNPSIDLVLMDIMMPDLDGYAAIARIREIEAHASLPIIALTAKAMKQDRERCIEAGASDYIGKPVTIDQLISVIRVWLYPMN